MTSSEIRRHFLDFFQSKQHLIVPSAPLVAKNDPTLMFNNSGMAQFKDFFLGNGTPPARRVADTQKCLRVSGKHNDLEDVGFDTYHHTMFEMLGNWSFGDYFKKEAIHWAWELLTDVYKLPKDRLYVSVFEGDERDGVPFDQEAFDLWKPIVGEDRIIYGNKKDNFWEMGDTGPCGPCSEIHVDLRSPEEVAQTPGKSLVNADHPQVVEIWNLVFMQFNRKAARDGGPGPLEPLPARHVDTGMGFERVCMAIQGKTSNYDTDVFSGTIQIVEQLSGQTYTAGKGMSDVAMRVIADHIRAVSFAIADGLVPSNAKAGYVIRRILRRAIRYGYSYLNLTEPFMTKLVPTLADQFKEVFPELDAQRDFVATVIREEEISFLRTLGLGLKRLDQLMSQLDDSKLIDGETVFELNDTFGFPADLTALVAREKGFSIDEAGFQEALQQQKQRSRKDAASSAGDWIDVNEVDTEFVGYDQTEADAQIVKYRTVQNKQGTQYQIVISPTPFYAESGGQIGDTGTLVLFKTGKPFCKLAVVDTKKENDLTIHIIDPSLAVSFDTAPVEKNAKGWHIYPPSSIITNTADGGRLISWPNASGIDANELEDYLKLADSVHAKVDAHRRTLTSSNHSATHLLHAALREVLGNHVGQKGSYVGPDALRFDFAHFAKLTDEELARVEQIVNDRIRENIKLDEKRNVPIEQAKALGATALFGEKYGDFVRVITFNPDFSIELCGGTHVPATGQIGLFKLTSEGSVSTGVRRIEAVTSEKALAMLNEQQAVLDQLKELLKAPKDVVKAVQALLDERSQLQKRIETLENEKLQQVKTALLAKVQSVNGNALLTEKVEVPSADALKQLAYDLKAKVDNLVLVLGADINGKPQLAVMLPEALLADKKLNAGQIVKELAKSIKGGGGGQPFFATAGGTDASGLDAALAQGRALFTDVL